MNSPEETQLSDDLHRIVDGPPATLDIDAIERSGQRQRRRSLAVRGLAGIGVLGVAVVGSLAAASHSGTTGSVAGQAAARTATGKAAGKPASPTGPVKAETVAYVEKHIAAAASDLNNYLVKSRQNTSSVGTPSVEITIWTDPRTGNTMLEQGSGASLLTYWEHDYFDSRGVLHWYQTQVNYGPRTYWIYDMHAAGPAQGPVPSGPVGGDYDSPAQVKQWLDPGVGQIVGHPYVDGHHTVELSITAGLGQDVRDLRRRPHVPGGPHDRLLQPGVASAAHHGQLHVGAEDPGDGEAGQPSRDPGWLHSGPRRLLAGRTARAHRSRCARATATAVSARPCCRA